MQQAISEHLRDKGLIYKELYKFSCLFTYYLCLEKVANSILFKCTVVIFPEQYRQSNAKTLIK